MSTVIVTREQLYRMYVEKDMSIVTIAFCLSIHSRTVSKLLTEYGIPKRAHGPIDHIWRKTVWPR